MADLKVNFAGLELKNPLMLASATPGWDGKRLKDAGQAGFGTVISKTISPRDAWNTHPRNGRMVLYRVGNKPVGMINMELFTTQPQGTVAGERTADCQGGWSRGLCQYFSHA